jgi:hypothetical protein
MGLFGEGTLWGGGAPAGQVPIPGQMPASQFIYLALRRVGHLRPGYKPGPEMNADALLEWQLLFDELGNQRNAQWSNPVYQYTVSGPGHQTGGNGYEIGPTARDWVGPRPDSIIRANCVLLNVGTQPVYIPLRPLTQEEWAGLSILQIPPITVTSMFWYDPQWPNGVFNVFPPLNQNAIQIYQQGILDAPKTIDDNYSAPPGYSEAIIRSLAARLQPLVTREVCIHPRSQAELNGSALMAWQEIASINRPLQTQALDMLTPSNREGFYDRFVTLTGNPQ